MRFWGWVWLCVVCTPGVCDNVGNQFDFFKKDLSVANTPQQIESVFDFYDAYIHADDKTKKQSTVIVSQVFHDKLESGWSVDNLCAILEHAKRLNVPGGIFDDVQYVSEYFERLAGGARDVDVQDRRQFIQECLIKRGFVDATDVTRALKDLVNVSMLINKPDDFYVRLFGVIATYGGDSKFDVLYYAQNRAEQYNNVRAKKLLNQLLDEIDKMKQNE